MRSSAVAANRLPWRTGENPLPYTTIDSDYPDFKQQCHHCIRRGLIALTHLEDIAFRIACVAHMEAWASMDRVQNRSTEPGSDRTNAVDAGNGEKNFISDSSRGTGGEAISISAAMCAGIR